MGKIIITIVAVVLIAGTVLYFVSDPVGTRMRMFWHHFTKWDSEKKQEDPVGYLTSAQEKADESIKALSARMMGLREQKGKNARMIQDQAKDLATAKDLFEQFRSAYREAAAAATWPKEVAGTSYQEDGLKTQIVSFKSKTDSLQQQKGQLEKLQKTLDSHIDEVNRRLIQASTTKSEIARSLEIVKANKAIEGLEKLRTDIDGLPDVAAFLAGEGAIPTVDDLIQTEQSTISDAEFNNIMNAEI
jgi:chromosome segregation ATPase